MPIVTVNVTGKNIRGDVEGRTLLVDIAST